MPNNLFHELEFFQKKINIEIEKYFEQYKQNNFKDNKQITNLVSEIQNITKNGKRIRAALIYYTYLAFGGKYPKKIVELSMFIEILHTYFLIHDDIMDQDDTRRSQETIHSKYQKKYQNIKKNDHAKIYGESIGIMAGDMASVMSYEIIHNSKFNNKTKQKIIKKVNDITIKTLTGQIHDINIEIKTRISKKDILNVYTKKTAQYTIEGPMVLGAIVAGKDNKKNLDLIKKFAIPLGIAFQIQDDILGIFGEEQEIGKPLGSDVKENKHTMLTWYAYSKADSKQKKVLHDCLGNQDLTKEQFKAFKQVLLDTGSFDYAKKEANTLLQNSLEDLNKIKLKSEDAEFLTKMAHYLINRNR